MGLFDSFASISNTSKTNRSNEKMNAANNLANKELWEQQTEYNTPQNQMTRLQAAGLNPNLAYGTIAESRASSPPDMNAAHFESPTTSFDDTLAGFQQVKNLHTLNARQNVDIETAKANAIKAAADADYAVYENDALKKSGMIKGDSSPLKYGVRKVGDFIKSTNKMIDNSSIWKHTKDAVSKITENTVKFNSEYNALQSHVGREEKAHISLPVPLDDDMSGGQ